MRRAAAITEINLGADTPLTKQRWNSLLVLELAEAGKNQQQPAPPRVQQKISPIKNLR
jgi:hypothetical protein